LSNRDKALASNRVFVRAEIRQADELSNGSAGAISIVGIVTEKGIPLNSYRASHYQFGIG
jgi:hypothetical protein